MLLIKCPICEKDISPNAEFCPNCGEPMKLIDKTDNLDKYSIVLLNGGNERFNLIHQIKSITGCGLKEAKDTFDKTPSIIISNVDYHSALNYKSLFENLGAKIEIVNMNIDQKFNIFINQDLQVNDEYVIKCSNCGSTNTKKISGVSKVGSVALFGVFSVGKLTKTYQCNKCGYRW